MSGFDGFITFKGNGFQINWDIINYTIEWTHKRRNSIYISMIRKNTT